MEETMYQGDLWTYTMCMEEIMADKVTCELVILRIEETMVAGHGDL